MIRTKSGKIVGSREAVKGLKDWRTLLRLTLSAEWDASPFEGPVEITLRFQLLRPKSISKEKRPWPSVKPDGSKLQRAVEDALVDAGVLRDDALIVSWSGMKVYKEVPGVSIMVTEL